MTTAIRIEALPARLGDCLLVECLRPGKRPWRMLIDDSRALAGEPYLAATARTPVARLSPATASRFGVETGTDGVAEVDVVLTNDRGELTLPLVVEPGMTDGVVWVPTRAPGLAVAEHLALLPGDLVTVGVQPRPRHALPEEAAS